MRQQGSGTLVLAGLSAGRREAVMRLEQLYRIRFSYPDGWKVDLEGEWEQHLHFAEGRCEGGISGRFRGVDFPQRRTVTGPFRADLRGVVETEEGAVRKPTTREPGPCHRRG